VCLGIAGQIIELVPTSTDLARVNVFGAERVVNVGLVESEGLKPGDWVLIHVGFAIAKMNEDEAKASMGFLQEMGKAFTNELGPAWEEESEEVISESLVNSQKKHRS
jgi:hydrogenase expression/formation protein HypC